MIDPIQAAKQKIQLNSTLQKATDTKNKLESVGQQDTSEWTRANAVAKSAQEQLNNLADPDAAINAAKDLLPVKELPIQPDPELIKKEAEAEAQKYKSQAEELIQQKKEEEIDKLKQRVEQAAGPLAPAVGLFLKLPIADAKFLAYTAYVEAKQKIRELKQKASKENLKKSKEAFTFPMKPPVKLELAQLPQVPQIPKIPEIPKITLPNLPILP
jgi:hypothetical protein